MFTHRIVIGDWSHDGHNQDKYFSFECSHDESEIKKAYKKAIKKCKVSLHEDRKLKGITPVCVEYEDSTIEEPQFKALLEMGVNFDFLEGFTEANRVGCTPKDIAYLFFEMVKTQINGFEYKMVPEKRTINGFWSEDFNYGFGYGCFQ